MSSTKGDPPPPGGGDAADSPGGASGGSAQSSSSADIKPPTLTDSESEADGGDRPIIVQRDGKV